MGLRDQSWSQPSVAGRYQISGDLAMKGLALFLNTRPIFSEYWEAKRTWRVKELWGHSRSQQARTVV